MALTTIANSPKSEFGVTDLSNTQGDLMPRLVLLWVTIATFLSFALWLDTTSTDARPALQVTPSLTTTPIPLPGPWRGNTISFTVISDFAYDFSWTGSACGFARVFVESIGATILPNGRFEFTSTSLSVTGNFTSPTSASGVWTIRNPVSFPPCQQSGLWNTNFSGSTPTLSASTLTRTATGTRTPLPSITPSLTATATSIMTPTPTQTSTSTLTMTPTPSPTLIESDTVTATPTQTGTPTPYLSFLPWLGRSVMPPLRTPTPTPTLRPTLTPTRGPTPTSISGVPRFGRWQGSTISFTVGQNFVGEFSWRGSACGYASIFVERIGTSIMPNGHFEFFSTSLSVTGDFTSETTASGTWTVRNNLIFPCQQSGVWSTNFSLLDTPSEEPHLNWPR